MSKIPYVIIDRVEGRFGSRIERAMLMPAYLVAPTVTSYPTTKTIRSRCYHYYLREELLEFD